MGVGEPFKDIPQGKVKCASIGMVETPVYALEIATSFKDIENAVLIFHDRSKIHTTKPYVKEIIKNNSIKVGHQNGVLPYYLLYIYCQILI